jgi:AcrR family transcriptional regulator
VDTQTFSEQKRLVEAAILLYLDEDDELTADAVCAMAGVERSVFEAHFDAAEDVLPAFYDLAIEQYRALRDATTDYHQFSFEERLATFFYILLDALAEQRAFVQQTFNTRIEWRSDFRSAVQDELRIIVAQDDVPSFNQLITGSWPAQWVLAQVTMSVISFWIRDDSPDREQTTALVDKLVAFVAELVTFRGVQRGVDLLWYLAQIDPLGLSRLPLIGRLFGGR